MLQSSSSSPSSSSQPDAELTPAYRRLIAEAVAAETVHLRADLACAERDARMLHDEVMAFQRDESYAAFRRACEAAARLGPWCALASKQQHDDDDDDALACAEAALADKEASADAEAHAAAAMLSTDDVESAGARALVDLACTDVAEPQPAPPPPKKRRRHVGTVGEAMEAAVRREFQVSSYMRLMTLAQAWTHLHALDGALFADMPHDRVHLGRAISRAFAHVPNGVLTGVRAEGGFRRLYRLCKRARK